MSEPDRPSPDASPPPSEGADSPRERELTAEEQEAAREARLQRLYDRIHERKDFPSLRDSIKTIQQVTRSDLAHMRALTDEVLQDIALTNKLLRLINAAFYSSVGGGSITTVQRAIALMGFESVGRLAASLALFDRLPPGSDGDRVRAEFSTALLGATLARQLCPDETVYVTALFQNLGSMLAWLHFPDDAQDVDEKLEALAESEPGKPIARNKVEAELLGLSYEDLGVEIARQWGWPDTLLQALRPRIPESFEEPVAREHYVRVLCTSANVLARRCEHLAPEEREGCARQFSSEWGVALGLGEADLTPDLEAALATWKEMEMVLGLQREAPPTPPGGVAQRSGTLRQALTQGLKGLSRVCASDAPMDTVYQCLMESWMSAMELQRCMVVLREPQAPARLAARHGLGDRTQVLMPLFQVPLSPPTDLFGLLALKGSDTLITDTDDPTIAKHLPLWFRTRMRANSFVVLPMALAGRPVGLLYGDRADAQTLVIGERELGLLKSMRDAVAQALQVRGASQGSR